MWSVLLSLVLLPLALFGELFQTDYDLAMNRGLQEKKPLLLFFNGSDWSGLGMKMKSEILSHPDFEKQLGEKLICVEIDFPKYHANVDWPKERNLALKQQFHVIEFPSLLLIDCHGREIVRLGYQPESGGQLAADLLLLIEQDRCLAEKLTSLGELSVMELKECYQLAEELQHSEIISQILAAGMQSQEPAFFLMEKYRILIDQGKIGDEESLAIRNRLYQIDPQNRQGYLFTLALLDFQALSNWEPRLPVEQVIAPLEDYLAQFSVQDAYNVWRVEMMMAQLYLEHDQLYSALQHAEVAYQTAPDERRDEVGRSLYYIRGQANLEQVR